MTRERRNSGAVTALAIAGAFAASLFAAAPSARADIIFTEGNHPQPGEQNILFGAKETGTTIAGEVDHAGIGVDFTSLTGETLNQNSSGKLKSKTTPVAN